MNRLQVICLAIALLALICSASAHNSGFDPKEVDPTLARGEAGKVYENAHHDHSILASQAGADVAAKPGDAARRRKLDKYYPIDVTPRHKWTEEEANKFFGHPSIKDKLEVQEFRKFLVDNGFHASKLELRWAPECGFHLIVTEPANALEEMMSVPENMFFHIYNRNLLDRTKFFIRRIHEYFFGPGIESEIDDLARVSMIVAILSEVRDSESYWRPYWKVLPKPTLPFMLTPEEAAKLELGRPVDFIINSRQRLLEDLARIAQAPEFEWLAKEFDESQGGLMNWAVAIIGSRTFSWGLGKFGNHLVMMPALDFINHNSDVPNQYEYTENQDLRYIVPHNVQPGEEVTIAYYPHAPNFYLFIEYGFVLSRNPQDHLLLEIDPLLTHKLYQNAFDLPKRIVVGYDDHIPYKFVRAINLAVLGDEDRVTMAAYNYLVEQLEGQLKNYTTTFEQDEAALSSKDLSPKDRLVISMRLECKRLLLDAIKTVKSDAEAFSTRGMDAVIAFNSARQPSDVYLDEPLRVVTLTKPSA